MPNDHAGLVLRGGRIHVLDPPRRVVEALAIADGRIAAIGSESEVRSSCGPRTETIDLEGRLVLPGFQDAHVHAVAGGLRALQCDLSGPADPDHYVASVRDYVEQHPGVGWVTGGGWSMAAFPGGTPTSELLDTAAQGRPVLLRNADGHGAWVSSRALELAGVDRSTPDPPDGRIERDPDGRPSGTLHEGAMRLVADHIPAVSEELRIEALRSAQRQLHALGITAWQDAIVARSSDGFADPTPAYIHLDHKGELTARVVGALWWDRTRGLEQIDELVAQRAAFSGERFRATSVKIMQDGVCENFTAAMLEPYLDTDGRSTGQAGISFVAPDVLTEAVVRLDALGFQIHVHAIGDRAVREALDAIAAARSANGFTDHRHHLAHLQVVHPDDVPRFRALGVVANAQPLWAMHEPQMDELTIPFLGAERSRRQYPWAALRASGAQLAFGSDWPVSSADPFELIHVAVNRAAWPGSPDAPSDGGPGGCFLPEQRIDLPCAIEAATIGSAYVNHLDDLTGTLEVGKAADLVVVDRDLFANPVEEIAGARAVLTLVDGEPVHDALT